MPGRGLLWSLPRLLFSSTSPLFMPLPLGCQIWLTQSVVSLLRLAREWKPSALHQRLIPLHWGREGRTKDRPTNRARLGVEGQQPDFNFLLFALFTLILDVGGVWGRPCPA